MVQCKIKVGKQEQEIIKEIVLQSPVNIKKRQRMIPICRFMSVLCFLGVAYAWIAESVLMGLSMFILCIFFIVFSFSGAEKLQKSVISGMMKKIDQEKYPDETEYIFDHDGIQINSEKGSGINYWKAFKCYGMIKNYIYIKRFDNQIALVDKEKLTPEKLCELEELLKANCKYDENVIQ